MKRWMIFLLVLILGRASHAQNTLYPIYEGNLWGYINRTGKVVIKPQFRNALAFSEGLAAVRIEGRYGYIDKTGRVVIAPSYDRGNPFLHGLAQVFRDGKQLFIDKNGQEVFQHSFASIMPFQQHSVTVAGTGTGKYCLIDRQGKMVTDTVFKEIERLGEAGFFGVYGLHHVTYPRYKNEVVKIERGIIDSNGHFVVPYGRYTNIKAFGRYYFSGTPVTDDATERRGITMVLNEKGEKVMESATGHYFEQGKLAGFFDGLAIASWYAEREDKSGKWYFNHDRRYIEVFDERGKVRINDTMWNEMTPFCRGRAFARHYNSHKWMLIDTMGNRVCDSMYNEVLFDEDLNSVEELFGNGVAYVMLQTGWAAIDTNGIVLKRLASKMDDYDEDEFQRSEDKIFFREEKDSKRSESYEAIGFLNVKTGTMVSPTYSRIDQPFTDGICIAMKDGRYCYINENGEVIWRSEKAKKGSGTLNIDYMNRGHYYAASEYRKELAGYGGWGTSDNNAQTLVDKTGATNQLKVVLDEGKKTKWNGYNAIKLFVTNYSGDTLYFDAQDSRLYLTIQAQKENGDWADVEFLPHSWCGNSYHQVFLAPGQYWQFATPRYEGEIKTKLRAKLLYKKQPNQEGNDVVYSNEISGSVNPGQFWYKRKHTPVGIMDPYID